MPSSKLLRTSVSVHMDCPAASVGLMTSIRDFRTQGAGVEPTRHQAIHAKIICRAAAGAGITHNSCPAASLQPGGYPGGCVPLSGSLGVGCMSCNAYTNKSSQLLSHTANHARAPAAAALNSFVKRQSVHCCTAACKPSNTLSCPCALHILHVLLSTPQRLSTKVYLNLPRLEPKAYAGV
jgi:hypothetical protein